MRRRIALASLVIVPAVVTGVVAARPADPGALLATVPLGATPSAIAADARTGRVYLLGDDGVVRVLDGPRARLDRPIDANGSGGPMVLDERDGRLILVSNLGNGVRLIDTRSGATLAKGIPVSGGLYPTVPALVARSGHLFVADQGQTSSLDGSTDHGRVTIVDVRAGVVVRRVLAGLYPRAVAVDARANRVYVTVARRINALGRGVGPGGVGVLDGTSGRLLRTIRVGTDPRAIAVDARLHHTFLTTGGADGAGRLSTLSADGRVLRSVAVGAAPTAPMVDAADQRVLLTSGKGLITIDGGSGRVLRVTPLDGAASVAVVDERRNRAFVVTARSVLLFDLRDGKPVRRLPIPLGATASLPLSVAPPLTEDQRNGRAYVVSAGPLYAAGNPQGAGTVYVLDARSGAILHALPAGLLPVAVSVDERRGRAYVISRGCPAPHFPCGRSDPAPVRDSWAWAPGPLRRLLSPLAPRRATAPLATTGSVTILDTTR